MSEPSNPKRLETDLVAANVKDLDHRRRVALEALAKLMPPGSSLTGLWAEVHPTRRQLRKAEFLLELARTVDRLEQQSQSPRVLTDRDAGFVEDAMAAVASRRGWEKRRAFLTFLTNVLTNPDPDRDHQDRVMACLEALRRSHLRLLAVVARDLEAHQPSDNRVRTGVDVELGEAGFDAESDPEWLERDWQDLVNWDVLKGNLAPIQHQGDVLFLRAELTKFGREFSDAIGGGMDQWAVDAPEEGPTDL